MFFLIAFSTLAGTRYNEGGNLPFSFRYNGRVHSGIAGLERLQNDVWKLEGEVVVRIEHAHDEAFDEEEYTVWFENRGKVPSAVLGEVVCLDLVLAGDRPVVRGILGDSGAQYRPYEHDLLKAPLSFTVDQGRASHGSFPYFDLVHGDGGTMVALGWSGNWQADFESVPQGLHVRARTNPSLASVLLPGEKVRTGQVVLLRYAGRDADLAMNRWRRWYLKRVLPRELDGSPLKPFSSAQFCMDTGIPNMDGSVSERSTTWRHTFDALKRERIPIDYRWFDAGWYCEPCRRTNSVDWHWVGTWILDSEKWPGTSFADMVAFCRREGMKTILWFEPERVAFVGDLVKNFGYSWDWTAVVKGQAVNDIGNPMCYAWTRDRVLKVLDENDVDLYREDYNIRPSGSWAELDARKVKSIGLPRAGITENFAVQAHYRLWDEIIANRRAHGRCPYVDSCASGGGRNDIESMRRGFPLMRSDSDRTTTARRLSQTLSLCRWLPFHGSFVKETKGVLDPSPGKGPDKYVFRASLLPICNLYESFTLNREFDFAQLRANLAEWRELAPYTLGDFHPLTPWRPDTDDVHWTVLAWNDPEAGRAILLAFRPAKCAEEAYTVKLGFLDPHMDYEVVDADEGTRSVFRATEAVREFELRLQNPRSCRLLRVRCVKGGKSEETGVSK